MTWTRYLQSLRLVFSSVKWGWESLTYSITLQFKWDRVCWENWTATCRRMSLDHFLTPYTKINSKWLKDLNVRQEAIKILEEKTSNNLFDLGWSTFLLHMSPGVRETKAKMSDWDLIKIKILCTAKETVSKTKRQPMEWLKNEWEKIFANQIKGYYPKSINNFSNLTSKKQMIQWRNEQKTWEAIFPKKSIWLTDTWKDAQHHSSSEKYK